MDPIVVDWPVCFKNEGVPLCSIDLDRVDHERLNVLAISFDYDKLVVIDREHIVGLARHVQ
jgi:hypothetical protein